VIVSLDLPVIFIYFVIFCAWLFLLKTFKALNGFLCADVPLRNYSLTIAEVYSTWGQPAMATLGADNLFLLYANAICNA